MTNRATGLLYTVSAVALCLGSGAALAADLPPFVPVAPEVLAVRTISGTMAIYGGFASLEFDEDEEFPPEDSPALLGGDARVNIPFADRWNLQFDIYGDKLFGDHDTSEDYTQGGMAGVHLNHRDPDHYLFGVFGGLGGTAFASTEDDAYTHWVGGVEGQWYLGNTTLYGQAGWLDSESNDSTSANVLEEAYFLRGVARHYFGGGNTKLEGEVGWASGGNDSVDDSPDDLDVLSVGAELEHVVWSFADDGFVSLFGRYEGYFYDEDFGDGTDEGTAHVFKIGLRMDLNQPDPLRRDRFGASVDLQTVNSLVGFSRTVE